MNERLVQDYLRDIVEACQAVREFVQGLELDDFRNDRKTSFAVIRALEIVGEAAKLVSPQWKEKYPAIPWKSLAGMRDKLIHGYFGVSLAVVWETATADLPAVEPLLREMLAAVVEAESPLSTTLSERSFDA